MNKFHQIVAAVETVALRLGTPPAQRAPTSLNPSHCFCWGLFGSALPEMLRLYKIAVAGQTQPDLHWYYVAMSLVLAICAGIFTVAWKPENPFKAIWVGVSFPVLISAMIQNTPSLR